MSLWNTKIKDLGKSETIKKGKKQAFTGSEFLARLAWEHRKKILAVIIVVIPAWNILTALDKLLAIKTIEEAVPAFVNFVMWSAIFTVMIQFIRFFIRVKW
jgi:hypothetical protein